MSAALLRRGAGAALLALAASAAAAEPDLTQYVNPLIGTLASSAPHTTDGGNVVPAAGLPSGMVQFGPDTRLGKKRPRAPMGYYYDANTITGFSLTHVSGAGCSSQGEFPVLPTMDPRRPEGRFQHANEVAAPGYYSVVFDSGIRTELSATLRSGMARFTFPAGRRAVLLLEASRTHSTPNPTAATIAIDADGALSGTVQAGDFCRSSWRTPVHFYARFDRPIVRSRLANGNAELEFGAGERVQMKIGLSYVSQENARDNLDRENSGWDFAAVHSAAKQAWNKRLNAIVVDGGDRPALTKFYTALYHALWAPSIFSDANGDYLGLDRKRHRLAPGQRAQYSSFSGWDVYRSLIPLRALLDPREVSDMAQSLVNDAAQCGALPRWVLNNQETGVMAGPAGVLMVAQAHAFGARAFDRRAALEAMTRMANQPGTACNGHLSAAGRASYLRYGYIAQDEWTAQSGLPGHQYIYCRDKNIEHNRCNAEGEIGHASTTLEYAVGDFAAARFAAILGERGLARQWLAQSGNWKNLMRAGAPTYLVARNPDGTWNDSGEFGETRSYLEGNAEQYTWMVAHDVGALVATLGGPAAATARLDRFFSVLNAGQELPNFYMGNEPGFALPWLYNWTGAPSRTQAVVQRIMQETFGTGPDGLAGNDDLGAVSAWYVWAALGLYPVIPGEAGLALSSPQFEAATVHLGAGGSLRITAPGAPRLTYIQRLALNGKPVTRPWLELDRIAHGGRLDFQMGAQPSHWGSAAADAPPSFGAGRARLRSLFNNRAVGGDFDGQGRSYPAEALGAAGVGPGTLVSALGAAIAWPAAEDGLDNAIALGQELLLDRPARGQHLVVLGAATNGPSVGQAVIHYADGGSEVATLSFDDWTGDASQHVVVTVPYVNVIGGKASATPARVYATALKVDPARTVTGLTLPAQVSAGRMHVFGAALAGSASPK
jgi:predicted alpha-1,2-mannosidase